VVCSLSLCVSLRRIVTKACLFFFFFFSFRTSPVFNPAPGLPFFSTYIYHCPRKSGRGGFFFLFFLLFRAGAVVFPFLTPLFFFQSAIRRGKNVNPTLLFSFFEERKQDPAFSYSWGKSGAPLFTGGPFSPSPFFQPARDCGWGDVACLFLDCRDSSRMTLYLFFFPPPSCKPPRWKNGRCSVP